MQELPKLLLDFCNLVVEGIFRAQSFVIPLFRALALLSRVDDPRLDVRVSNPDSRQLLSHLNIFIRFCPA